MIKLASLFRCVLLLGGAKRYENEKWIKDLSKDMVSILFCPAKNSFLMLHMYERECAVFVYFGFVFFLYHLCVSSFCVVETVRTYHTYMYIQVQVHTYIHSIIINYICM